MSILNLFKKNKNITNKNGLNEKYHDEGYGDLNTRYHMKNGLYHGKYFKYWTVDYSKKNPDFDREDIGLLLEEVDLVDGIMVLERKYKDGFLSKETKWDINSGNDIERRGFKQPFDEVSFKNWDNTGKLISEGFQVDNYTSIEKI